MTVSASPATGFAVANGQGCVMRSFEEHPGVSQILQMIRSALTALGVLLCATPALLLGVPAVAAGDGIIGTVKAVEVRIGGRVGVAVYYGHSGRLLEYRSQERFPMSSTFKAFACGAVLARVDAGKEDLRRVIKIAESDLVNYSPITKKRTGDYGMKLSQVCEAALSFSDNTAGNIILQSLSGPSGFTAFMRSMGDRATRLDRWETALNQGAPGDARDTTTPKSAARSLRKLLFGDVLSARSRNQLSTWMLNDKVAGALFRSVLPEGWRIADKTGAGGHGSRAIVAVMWPPDNKPIVAAVYMTNNSAEFSERNAAIAEIGAAIVREVSEK